MAIMERTPPRSIGKRISPRKMSLEPSSSREGEREGSQAQSTPTRAQSANPALIPPSSSSSSSSSGQVKGVKGSDDNPFLKREDPAEEMPVVKEEDQALDPFGTRGGGLNGGGIGAGAVGAVGAVDPDERPIKGSHGIGYNLDLDLDEASAFKDTRRDAMRDQNQPSSVPSKSPSPIAKHDAAATSAIQEQVEEDFAATPKQSKPSTQLDEAVRSQSERAGAAEGDAAPSAHRSTSVQPQSQPQSQIRPQSQIPRAIPTSVTGVSNPSSSNNPNAFRSSQNGPPASTSKPTFNPSTTPLKTKQNLINTPLTPIEHYNPVIRAERVATLELVNVKKELATTKKQLALTEKKLKSSEEKGQAHLTDAEGWREECETIETNHKLEIEKLEKELSRLENHLQDSEIYRKESRINEESKTMKVFFNLKDSLRDANCELVLARNEGTYQLHRSLELEIELKESRDTYQDLLENFKEEKSKNKKLKREVMEKSEEIDQLNNLNLELEEKLESSADNQELESQLKELKKELKEIQKENSKITKELEKATTKSEKLENLVEKEQSEKQDLKEKLKEMERKLASRPVPTSPSSPPPKTHKASSSRATTQAQKRKQESEEEAEEDQDEDDEFEEPPKKSKPKTAVSKSIPAASSLGAGALPRKRRLPMQGASDLDLRSSPPNLTHGNRKSQLTQHENVDEDAMEDPDEELELEVRKNSPSPKKIASSSTSRKPTATNTTSSKSKKSAKEPEEPVVSEDEDDEDEFVDSSKKNNKGKSKASDKNKKTTSSKNSIQEKQSLDKINEVQATPMISKTKSKNDGDEVKKKKRKLLGGGGGISGWNTEGGSKLDIPMELSPLKTSNPHAMRPPSNSRLGFNAGASNNISSFLFGKKI